MPSPVRDASLALGSMFSILLLTEIIWLLMPSLRGMGTGPMDNLPQAALILLPIALVIAGGAGAYILLQRRFLQLEFTVKAKPRQTFSDV